MTWNKNTLSTEILEEFADVRWSGMAANAAGASYDYTEAAGLEVGVVVSHENTDWRMVTKKADDGFVGRALEIIKTWPVWMPAQLAKRCGDNTAGGATAAGMLLAKLPGWRVGHTRQGALWVNVEMLLDYLHGRTDVNLSDLQHELDVHPNALSRVLREQGWTRRRHKKKCLWNPPAATQSHETAQAC